MFQPVMRGLGGDVDNFLTTSSYSAVLPLQSPPCRRAQHRGAIRWFGSENEESDINT